MSKKRTKGPRQGRTKERESDHRSETAAAEEPLPKGFERVGELTVPTPQRAARDLLRVLESLQPWERFPEDLADWTPGQRSERGAPMPGNYLIEWDGGFIEGHDREHLVAEWESRTGQKRGRGQPVVRRSPVDLRREWVLALHTGLEVFLGPAIAAVLAAGGSAEPLRELERDPLLHVDTVAAAVAELRLSVSGSAVRSPAQHIPPPERHNPRRRDGTLKPAVSALLRCMPQPTLAAAAEITNMNESTVETWSPVLQALGWIRRPTAGEPWTRTADGDRALGR